jgi:hypothetical protein
MNLVLDDAEEVLIKKKSRKPLGECASDQELTNNPRLTRMCIALASRCEQGASC